MKTILLCVTVGLTLAVSIPAHAQFMVLDAANLSQAIQQMAAWKKQYQQMLDQKTQLQQQYTSMTGSRGLGSYASNPSLQAIVPVNLVQTYNDLQTRGTQGLTGSALNIRNQAKIYDCEDRRADDRILCQRILNGTAQQQALSQSAMTLLNQRVTQIQTLQDKINATGDAKAIAELQARLQAENTQVGNDTNRLMLMRSLADAADRAAEQAVREKAMKNLSLHNDGSETFVFVPMRGK